MSGLFEPWVALELCQVEALAPLGTLVKHIFF